MLRRMLLAAAASFALIGAAIADEYTGTWQVMDTQGKPFEIVLAADGTASANRGEGMKGKWENTAGVLLITWDTGWTTKIWKDGASYKKSAIPKGGNETVEPTEAVKK